MHEAPSVTWGHKAGAFLALLGASALFTWLIVWPVVAPFVPVQYTPSALVRSAVVDFSFDDAFDALR